jgi:hypothetical protein
MNQATVITSLALANNLGRRFQASGGLGLASKRFSVTLHSVNVRSTYQPIEVTRKGVSSHA